MLLQEAREGALREEEAHRGALLREAELLGRGEERVSGGGGRVGKFRGIVAVVEVRGGGRVVTEIWWLVGWFVRGGGVGGSG